VIADLFGFFMKMPRTLPLSYQEKARHEPLHRIVCDYLAGMTDGYILEQHRRFFPAKKRLGV
jgi:dGTPase